MARLPEGTFKQWKDGDVVNARDYMQELEIIRAAVNDNYDRVNILEGAAGGEIKRVPFGTSFPTSPTEGDIFFRTDEGVLYILNPSEQWVAFSPKAPADAHINNKENPHAVTASQTGAYSKLETDNKFVKKGDDIEASSRIKLNYGNGFIVGPDVNGGYGLWADRFVLGVGNGQYFTLDDLYGANGIISGNVRFLFHKNDPVFRMEHYSGSGATLVVQTVTNTSDRDLKKNIVDYTESALEEINSTPIRKYQFKDEDENLDIAHLGIIMQEAPLDVVDSRGKGVDPYAMVTMAWKAIQELSAKNQELENRLALLESKEG